jgi:3-oxoacyl-[acyl-carrier protein] reductase
MITARLDGKTALVTGGASGIGLATVEILARAGATVALNYRPGNGRGPRETARLVGAGLRVIGAPGDVADAAEAEPMVAAAVERLGRLDILVNNAGTANTNQPIALSDLEAMTEDRWDAILDTNLLGPYRCTRAAVPALRQSGGTVINTASVAGLNVEGSSIAYAASKAALINLTRNLARALAPEVRVNAVAPGLVDSPWIGEWPPERIQRTIARTPLGRMCSPEDIAEAILFLAAGGSMITGHVLVVDGGLSL